MKFNNEQIYQLNILITNNLNELNIYLPAKVNFFMQKNIKLIAAAASEIEEARLRIAQHYGELDENTNMFSFSENNIDIVNKELQELLSIEQDLDIKTFSIDLIEELKFTPAQMQAIMFMIED